MRYTLRPAREEDYQFLYHLHVAATREYVERTWGWDEEDQRRRFQGTFRPEGVRILLHEGQPAGMLSLEERPEELFLAGIHILPEHRNRGLGTAVLRDILSQAERRGLPVTLQVLKVNPARRLYERLGFRCVEETATHYRMRADPAENLLS